MINLTEVVLTDANQNSGGEADYTPAITVDDVNFDGQPDLAIGHARGGYGAVTATIYLFDPAAHHFVLNDAISRLSEGAVEFAADPVHKRLQASQKSGAGYQVTELYRVDHDQPVLVSRHTEDGDAGTITDETLVGTQWRKRVRRQQPGRGTRAHGNPWRRVVFCLRGRPGRSA